MISEEQRRDQKTSEEMRRAEALGLAGIKNREWQIFQTSATKGEGITEGLDWLHRGSRLALPCSSCNARRRGDREFTGACKLMRRGQYRRSRRARSKSRKTCMSEAQHRRSRRS